MVTNTVTVAHGASTVQSTNGTYNKL